MRAQALPIGSKLRGSYEKNGFEDIKDSSLEKRETSPAIQNSEFEILRFILEFV